MSRKQNSCMKIVAAHPRPHFPVDERVFMILKCPETKNVRATIRTLKRQFPNQRSPCRQTIMDNYNKFVQYGLSLNRNVGKSGRSCSETAFETFWLFPEHYWFTDTLKPFSHPFIYWKLWSGMWCAPAINYSYSSSAFCSIHLFQFLFSVIVKHYRILDYVTRVIIPLFKW